MTRRLAAVLVVLLTIVGLQCGLQAPALADAKSGVCGAGYRLGDYTTHKDAYNHTGEHMWQITYRKRWCYSPKNHRIASWYASSSVRIYSYFGLAWRYKGVTDHDEYYSNTDALGRHHPKYPRLSHVSWKTIKMDHCAVHWTACTSHYYHLGIKGFYDGSKKLA